MASEIATWQQEFSLIVWGSTGLDPAVVLAWVLAEGGPATNPLNIGPGRRYANVEEAAKATVALLRNPRYAGILRAAREGNPKAQLKAIELSPWNLGRTGAKPAYGELLRGTYERAKDQIVGEGHPEFGKDPAKTGNPITDPIVGAVEGVAQFAFDKAVLALGYVVLTGAGVALFVMGLNRVSGSAGGPTVQGAARTVAGAATRGRGSDIPF